MSCYIDHVQELVHLCQIDEQLGVGITPCGLTFLVGSFGYKEDDTVDERGTYRICKKCSKGNCENHAQRWRRIRRDMARTLMKLSPEEDAPRNPHSLSVLLDAIKKVIRNPTQQIGHKLTQAEETAINELRELMEKH